MMIGSSTKRDQSCRIEVKETTKETGFVKLGFELQVEVEMTEETSLVK